MINSTVLSKVDRIILEKEIPVGRRFRLLLLGTPIYSQTEQSFLDGLVRTLTPLASALLVIAGNYRPRADTRARIVNVRFNTAKSSSLGRSLQFLSEQIAVSRALIGHVSSYEYIVVHAGEYRNIIPILVSKLMRKKILIHHFGGDKFVEAKLEAQSRLSKFFLPYVQWFALLIVYRLVDVILVEAFATVEWGRLTKFRGKIATPIHPEGLEGCIDLAGESRRNLICFIGRLVAKRDLTPVINAIPTIMLSFPDTTLIIVGRGPLLDRYRNLVVSLDLHDHLKLLPYVADLQGLYQEAKLLVFPSVEEGIPHVVIEAMCNGVIVVASPVGAIPEIVRPGKTGFFLQKLDTAGVASSVIEALSANSLSDVAREAQRLVISRYGFEITVKKYQDIFQRLAEPRLPLSDHSYFYRW